MKSDLSLKSEKQGLIKFHFQGIVSLHTALTYQGLLLEPSSTVKLKILLVPKCIVHIPNSVPLLPSFSEPGRSSPLLFFLFSGAV